MLLSARQLPATPHDPLAVALTISGGRSTFRLVVALMDGPLRFSRIRAALPGISANILTNRLRTLEAVGLIEVQPIGGSGMKRSYALTIWGAELGATREAIVGWTRQNKARREQCWSRPLLPSNARPR
ncbi:winged helix-turn-helix transcriptional regulator [Rhizobium sp. 2YAF20]|uniref:winged helix-turn-helix transcriptional regulator n=1 Tax=Rhizobium sp. 2YAF20 TaxID=3233027 RepID=UPI003F988D83